MTRTREARGWALNCGLMIAALGCTTGPAATAPPKVPVSPKAPAALAAPDVIDPQALQSTATSLESVVAAVTVYSDRARVTRQSTAELSSEPKVFAFRALPGWVDDGSVRVSSSTGRIVDVRVERNFLAKATDAKWRAAEAHHQALANQLAALTDEITILDAQKNQIESMKAFSLAKVTQDTTIGNISVKSYAEVLEFISDALRSTAKARRAAQRRLSDINPKFQASLRTLAEMKNLMKLEQTTVLVTLQAKAATKSSIELTYMLPGVTWEPMHELRASTSDAKKVEVISFASVTQTSGEDWGQAQLSFSTQSSTQSVRIPQLEALTLGDTHTATRRLTSKVSSFTRAQQAFRAQSQLWNKVHQRARTRSERVNFDKVYQSNIEYLEVVQGKTVQIFESLQKRGTTAHFRANAASSVRGDGHPVRMRIGRSILGSSQRIVAVPEQSLNAARTLVMTNSTGQSFLPGKVALYQDGAFLGMTEMDFIAEGESFSLFLSVADHIKLSRKLDRKQSTLIRKKRNRMQLTFLVTASNLSAHETSFTLVDRIPVSENKAIRIDRVRITPIAKPDSQGLLRWDLTLKPKQTRQFQVSYRIEYPAELLIESRRRRMQKSRRGRTPARPGSIGKKYDFEDQLLDLEKNF